MLHAHNHTGGYHSCQCTLLQEGLGPCGWPAQAEAKLACLWAACSGLT